MRNRIIFLAVLSCLLLLPTWANATGCQFNTRACEALNELLCADDTTPFSCSTPGTGLVTGDLVVTGSITGGAFVLNKIYQGNSSVEVIDTGTGSVVWTLDGSIIWTLDATALTAVSDFNITGDVGIIGTLASGAITTTAPVFTHKVDDTIYWTATLEEDVAHVVFRSFGYAPAGQSEPGFHFLDHVQIEGHFTVVDTYVLGRSASFCMGIANLSINGGGEYAMIDIDISNGTHSGSTNYISGIQIRGITPSAFAEETAYKVDFGWDYILKWPTGYISNTILQLGANGTSGQIGLYSEQGATDYMATIKPHTAMTSNAFFYFPADEPAGTYLMNMTSGGVMGFDSKTYLTAESFVTFTATNPAGQSATTIGINPVLGIMDGSDIYNALNVAITNANHTGAGNEIRAINIANITGDADATETAIKVGTGWDKAIVAAGAIDANYATSIATATDYDLSTLTTTITDSASANLTGYVMNLTDASTIDAGGYNGMGGLQITLPDGPNVDINTVGIGHSLYINDLKTGAEATVTDPEEASVYLSVVDASRYGLYTTGSIGAVGLINKLGNWTTSSTGLTNNNVSLNSTSYSNFYCGIRAYSTIDPGTANYVTFGNSFIIEGETVDTDELFIAFPAFTDGGAGDQGNDTATGVYCDPAVTMVTASAVLQTIADTGDANPAVATLDPYQWESIRVFTCNDAHTCDVTMQETSSTAGQRITITNTMVNAVDISDVADVVEVAGGTVALGINDTITLIYTGTIWIETGRSDN